MSLRFSIVICSYNRHKLLTKAIESALRQTFGRDMYDVIVVDNSSDVAAALSARERYLSQAPRLQYLVEDTPGLSRARNVALHCSKAEYIAFLDDDAIAHDNWLEQIDHVLNTSGGNIGVVGGRVRPIWESPPPKWLLPGSVDPSEVNNHEFPMVGNFSVVNWGGDVREPKAGEWLAGANIVFHREALIAAGGFDQNLGRQGNGHSLLSNEEGNAIGKLKNDGWQVRYAPEAIVDHFVPDERVTQGWLVRRISWQVVSDLIEDGSRLPLTEEEVLSRFSAVSGFDARSAQAADEVKEFRLRILAYAALVQSLLVGDVENLEKVVW